MTWRNPAVGDSGLKQRADKVDDCWCGAHFGKCIVGRSVARRTDDLVRVADVSLMRRANDRAILGPD